MLLWLVYVRVTKRGANVLCAIFQRAKSFAGNVVLEFFADFVVLPRVGPQRILVPYQDRPCDD